MKEYETKLYRRWRTMNDRCRLECCPSYKDYGARGIKVCEEWNLHNPEGYKNFKAWMISQGYDETLPRGMQTIDRIDVNGNYCPENCRIITLFEQAANTRKNVYITYNGEKHHVREWARITGLTQCCITKRLRSGMSPEEIFNTPRKPTDTKYSFTYEGKEYTTLTAACKEYGVDIRSLSYLIRRRNYSVEGAIDHERKKLQMKRERSANASS